jgi:hypothetical protein
MEEGTVVVAEEEEELVVVVAAVAEEAHLVPHFDETFRDRKQSA